MGVTERRARELAELADAALDSVERIAADEGWDAVTIRRVAETVEWSPPKLYALFGDKAGLAAAARERAFAQLLSELQRTVTTEPRQRLVDIAERHWRFAISSPSRFQLMHGLAPAPCPTDAHTVSAARQAFELLTAAVRDVLEQNPPRGRADLDADARAEAQLLWATLFGIAALHIGGQLPANVDGRRLGVQAVERTARR